MNYKLGLIGHPVAKSLSPAMHRAALAYCGLSGSYELHDIPPERLAPDVAKICNDGLVGFNVTIPHKVSVLELCTERSPEVAYVGAANTVTVRADGSFFADNTDVFGFEFALFDAMKVDDKSKIVACILGAGGAAKAAAAVALKNGFATTFVLARDKVKAEQLCAQFGSQTLKPVSFKDHEVLSGITVLANTIPFGLTAQIDHTLMAALVEGSLAANAFVFDMVYSREGKDTQIVELAKEKGVACCDGRGMLAAQAMQSFEIWTGQKVPYQIMIGALNQALLAGVGI